MSTRATATARTVRRADLVTAKDNSTARFVRRLLAAMYDFEPRPTPHQPKRGNHTVTETDRQPAAWSDGRTQRTQRKSGGQGFSIGTASRRTCTARLIRVPYDADGSCGTDGGTFVGLHRGLVWL